MIVITNNFRLHMNIRLLSIQPGILSIWLWIFFSVCVTSTRASSPRLGLGSREKDKISPSDYELTIQHVGSQVQVPPLLVLPLIFFFHTHNTSWSIVTWVRIITIYPPMPARTPVLMRRPVVVFQIFF